MRLTFETTVILSFSHLYYAFFLFLLSIMIEFDVAMLEYLYFSLVTSSQVYFHFDSSRLFSSIFSSTFESSFRVGRREGEDDFAYMFLRNTNCVSCCMLITQKAALFRHCKQICFYVSILPNCIFTLENVQLFLYHFFYPFFSL